MSGSDDARVGTARLRAVGWAAVVLGGSLVAVVGFVAATASLVAGFGVGKPSALRVALLSGAASLLAAFLALFGRTAAARSRPLAGLGTAVAVGGLALCWRELSPGWTGRLGELPPTAVGAYAVGLLVLFGTGFTVDRSAERSGGSSPDGGAGDAVGGVESALAADDVPEDPRDDRS